MLVTVVSVLALATITFAQRDACRTCEIVVNIARHHFHNNITDQAALKAQLVMECGQLVNVEGQAAVDHCLMVVNDDAKMTQIFMDLSTGKHPRQTCEDIGECNPRTTMVVPQKRVKRQDGEIDSCRVCEILMNVAIHHFSTGAINDKTQLRTQLLLECQRLGQFEGQPAADHCISIVDNNIDRIYDDLHAGVNPLTTCTDIHQCGNWWETSWSWSSTHPTPPAKIAQKQQQLKKRVKRQMQQDPCRTCEIIMNIALHHFHNNITDQAALLTQLQEECRRLAQFEGQNASMQCTAIVTTNIDKIYMDLSTGAGILYTCQDLMICGADATTIHFPDTTPAPPQQHRFKRQAGMSTTFFPHDPCRTCELVMNIAIHHFANGVTDKDALLAQLIMECDDPIGTHDGPMAADNCKQIVNQRIDQIFADLSNGTNPRRTCVDLGYCRGRVVNRVKRQMAPEPCRLCEIVVNIARHHFHNNITDEGALIIQLQAECANLGSTQGQAWAEACTALVTAKGHMIYVALANNEHGRQTCTDIGECMMMTTMLPPLKRVKRQSHDPCRVCETLISIARRHFHNNITDEAALGVQLHMECDNLGMHGFTAQEVQGCNAAINDHLHDIYLELSNNPNLNVRQVCQDFGECPTGSPPPPPVWRRVKRQAHDPCRLCETLISIARRHFHNNITDEAALGVQLHMECDNLGMHGFTAQEVQSCNSEITEHLHEIYLELVNNPNLNVRQVCQAFGECPSAPPPPAL